MKAVTTMTRPTALSSRNWAGNMSSSHSRRNCPQHSTQSIRSFLESSFLSGYARGLSEKKISVLCSIFGLYSPDIRARNFIMWRWWSAVGSLFLHLLICTDRATFSTWNFSVERNRSKRRTSLSCSSIIKASKVSSWKEKTKKMRFCYFISTFGERQEI